MKEVIIHRILTVFEALLLFFITIFKRDELIFEGLNSLFLKEKRLCNYCMLKAELFYNRKQIYYFNKRPSTTSFLIFLIFAV